MASPQFTSPAFPPRRALVHPESQRTETGERTVSPCVGRPVDVAVITSPIRGEEAEALLFKPDLPGQHSIWMHMEERSRWV